MWMLRTAFALVLAAALSACTSMEVQERTFQYNQATGSLGARLLLLNAVRAAQRYPLQFTRISEFKGEDTISGKLTGKIPFGPQAVLNNSFDPTLDWNSGLNSLTVLDLNTEEAQSALKRPLTPNDFSYYFNYRHGRSFAVITALFVEHVIVHKDLYNAIDANAEALCPRKISSGVGVDPLCLLIQQMPRCAAESRSSYYAPADYRILTNSPSDECERAHYLRFWFMAYLAEIVPNPILPEKNPPANPEAIAVNKNVVINVLKDESKAASKPAGDVEVEFKRLRVQEVAKRVKAKHLKPMIMKLRSPESMVRYLGELIELQNLRGRPPMVVFDIELRRSFVLFRAVEGRPLPGEAAVSVPSPDGSTYYIPKPDYRDPSHDRSLEALSIVADILNGAVSKGAIPQQTTFSLSTSQ